jgi:hypothetical protein|tara:strand:- start:32 stop:235 length:204 start_codon:yes stop_codon:yes gene_type:complete
MIEKQVSRNDGLATFGQMFYRGRRNMFGKSVVLIINKKCEEWIWSQVLLPHMKGLKPQILEPLGFCH